MPDRGLDVRPLAGDTLEEVGCRAAGHLAQSVAGGLCVELQRLAAEAAGGGHAGGGEADVDEDPARSGDVVRHELFVIRQLRPVVLLPELRLYRQAGLRVDDDRVGHHLRGDVEGGDDQLAAHRKPALLLVSREQREALVDAAEAGANIVACVDDAYTGLFYEEDIFNESLFSLLAGAHPRIASIKIDGPTKEDYVWGFRVGFITFSLAESEGREEVYGVLEKKVGGLIRGTISKSSMPAQSLLVHAMKTAGYREEKDEKFVLLKDRYDEVKTVLSGYDYADAFRAYPFNSGYFMCLRLLRTDAELLRRHLLDEYGVGVIAMGDRDIRIAFSCIEKEQIKDLFDILYTGVKDLDKNLRPGIFKIEVNRWQNFAIIDIWGSVGEPINVRYDELMELLVLTGINKEDILDVYRSGNYIRVKDDFFTPLEKVK